MYNVLERFLALFERWLVFQPTNALAGCRASSVFCPISQFMVEMLDCNVIDVVTSHDTVILYYPDGGPLRNIYSSPWIAQFTKAIDTNEGSFVTSGECLQVLKKV